MEKELKELLKFFGDEDSTSSEEFFSVITKFSLNIKVFFFFFSFLKKKGFHQSIFFHQIESQYRKRVSKGNDETKSNLFNFLFGHFQFFFLNFIFFAIFRKKYQFHQRNQNQLSLEWEWVWAWA